MKRKVYEHAAIVYYVKRMEGVWMISKRQEQQGMQTRMHRAAVKQPSVCARRWPYPAGDPGVIEGLKEHRGRRRLRGIVLAARGGRGRVRVRVAGAAVRVTVVVVVVTVVVVVSVANRSGERMRDKGGGLSGA